ncbi:arylsulfatase [Gluconobacter oxydans]|uniref:arylsulfatase n=1 Tax=Gluconobacter oxydans TaxID=442 RepID=UPI0039E8CCF9
MIIRTYLSLLLGSTLLFGVAQQSVRAAEPPEGTQGWPQLPQAPQNAPNIVVILIDDVGFGATNVFGGPISTPDLTRLAGTGLRYNNFHVNALCSPSRASLLTGYNDRQVGFGNIEEAASKHPGYNTVLPTNVTPIAEVLKEHGYNTAAFGKWHNTPYWQISAAGPFDLWPTGRWGFEHFYGFLAAADNQYYPRLYRDQTPVEPSSTPEQGYYFTTDITNEAIRWMHQHDAVAHDKPFFIYYATGATHEPHHVPKAWIAKYKGKFDQGWDVIRQQSFDRQKALGVIPANAELTPRPSTLPAWDSLSPDEKKLLAHQAEVYAAFAEETDQEVGRLLATLREEGISDNTLVLEIFGDNGGSAEGGFLGKDVKNADGSTPDVRTRLADSDALGSELYFNHYAAAWAWALTSPFQGTKQDAAHLGGTTDPLVISWPARIHDANGLRGQFGHLNDIAPTLYEAAGITPPTRTAGIEQIPLEGKSLLYTFDHPDAPSRHRVQYFTTSGNLGIYSDGWWAGQLAQETWEVGDNRVYLARGVQPRTHPWELYRLSDDYSQAHDLAAKYPEKLKELQALFQKEAIRNHADPIRPGIDAYPLGTATGQTVFTYRFGVDRVSTRFAPDLGNDPYTLSADVDIPAGGAQGVIFAEGGRYGGVALYVSNGRLVYEVNAHGVRTGQIVTSAPLPVGKRHIVVTVAPEQERTTGKTDAAAEMIRRWVGGKPVPAAVTLSVDGAPAGQAHFSNIALSSKETLDIGRDLGSAVSPAYTVPAAFTGHIDKVTLTTPGLINQ